MVTRRPAISNDYMVYLHETETNLSINDNDPILFSQAVSCDNSKEVVKCHERRDKFHGT